MKRMLRRNKNNPTSSRLGCESLEDRRLLAVMVATEAELRAAVLSPVGDPDVVMTADITLTTGELQITETVNLDGGGFTLTQTLADARVINVDADPTMASPVDSFAASISNLTVTGGYTSFGAGVRNNEDLTITNSSITGNRSVDPGMTYTGFGGGVATNGSLTMVDSYITGNTAGSLVELPTTAGGYYAKGLGGGLFANTYSQLDLTNVAIDGNNASNAGGGVNINGIGPHSITGGSIDNNAVGNTAAYPIRVGANDFGGGIYVDAGAPGIDLTISGTSLSNNEFGGTAVAGDNNFSYGGGGDFTTRGTTDVINLTDLTVSGNSSTNDGITGGGLSIQRGGGITMTTVEGGIFNVSGGTFAGNSLAPAGDFPQYGGAMSFATFDTGAGIAYAGDFNVDGVTIRDNYAGRGAAWGIRYNGGYNNDGIGARNDISITGATVTGNSVGGGGDGGGVHWAWIATDLTVEDSIISGNYSPSGGGAFINLKAFNNSGLYSNADLTVRNSQITGNTSLTTGGAFDVTTSLLTYPGADNNLVVVEDSEISNNVAFGNGGGFYAYDSDLTIFNSTVSGNTSFGVGGGVNGLAACDVSGGGGPCYTGTSDEPAFIIDRSTFANNYSGGNGTLNFADNTGFDIDNTIIGDSLNATDDLIGGGGTMTPNFLEVHYSLAEANLGLNPLLVGNGNLTLVDPALDPLADNGAVTQLPDGTNVQTHALGALSPALGTADPARLDDLDQRMFSDGAARSDMGAYEDGATGMVPVDCDFDNDNDCDLADIDALTMETAAGTNNLAFDISGDGVLVNQADITEWLIQAGAHPGNALATGGNPFYRGDFNLDGFVNGSDFVIWNTNKFPQPAPVPGVHDRWSNGNADGNMTVDGPDFIIWNSNKFCESILLGGPQCNAGPPPNIVDNGGFGGTIENLHDRVRAAQQVTGKRTLQENMQMRDLNGIGARMRGADAGLAAGAVVTSNDANVGFTADSAVDSRLATRNVSKAEGAAAAKVVRAPSLATRVVATDSSIRETARAEEAVDNVFANFGL